MSPLFAALTARLMNIYGINTVQQAIQNGGYYRMFSFHDIITGNIGGYSAGVGWDAVTGMGSFAQYFASVTSTSKLMNSWSTFSTTTATSTSTASILSEYPCFLTAKLVFRIHFGFLIDHLLIVFCNK